MKEKIAFVGLGQCGSNIASIAEVEGYVTGIMNTSQEDLNAPTMKYIKNKLLLGDTGGAGKDRKIAKDNIKTYYKEVIDFFKKHIILDEIKIVYICFSSGGGTGSGFGPILIDVLKKFFPNIYFSAIIVTPSNDESSISLFNSRKCLEEIYNLEIPVLILDNEKVIHNGTKKEIYDTVNNDIVEYITNFVERRESSSISNMDEMDKQVLLTTNGNMIITEIEFDYDKNMSSDKLTKIIQDSFDNNVYAPIEYDKVIKNVGYIFEVPDSLTKFIIDMDINKITGIPLRRFEGIYESENSKKCKIITILTGLSFPESKIKKIDHLLDKINQSKIKDKEVTSSLENSQKISLFDEDISTKTSSLEDSTVNLNLEDLFNNY